MSGTSEESPVIDVASPTAVVDTLAVVSTRPLDLSTRTVSSQRVAVIVLAHGDYAQKYLAPDPAEPVCSIRCCYFQVKR